MPNAKTLIEQFIEDIKDEKLSGFSETGGTEICGDVQINKGTKIPTLKNYAGATVAFLLVSRDNPSSPATIRDSLVTKIAVNGDATPK